MPVIYGNVAGRQHDAGGIPRRWARCRKLMPVEMWERVLVWQWREENVSVEAMANRLMRPVSQVVEIARIDGRRA